MLTLLDSELRGSGLPDATAIAGAKISVADRVALRFALADVLDAFAYGGTE